MASSISADTSYVSPPAKMSTGEGFDFPYRAINKSAVASCILFAFGLSGLLLYPGLVLAVVGLLMAVWAIRSIRAFPNEFSGGGIAKFGLLANAALLIGGIGYHGYVYVTEVPEGYTRVGFYELQPGDGAPDRPTPRAIEVNGQDVFLKGYVHPTSGSGMLRRFILVPDMGTCCFGGQPKSSDMVDVSLPAGVAIQSNVLQKKLAGQFQVSPMGQQVAGFENGIFYRFKVDQIR